MLISSSFFHPPAPVKLHMCVSVSLKGWRTAHQSRVLVVKVMVKITNSSSHGFDSDGARVNLLCWGRPPFWQLHSRCVNGKSIQFHKSDFAFLGLKTQAFSQIAKSEDKSCNGWSFVGGSKLNLKPKSKRVFVPCKADPAVYASLWTNSQIARSVFTLGTAAVLPFYTLMVVAPKAEMTKKSMGSCLPYIVFGIVYAYLLYLSWTPDTLRAMFASKYWMPELSAIASLFTNEMSLSSAWIHLLAIDLFAARQVYHEGLTKNIETRHSVSLCLLFCPIGLLSHFITKIITEKARG